MIYQSLGRYTSSERSLQRAPRREGLPSAGSKRTRMEDNDVSSLSIVDSCIAKGCQHIT